MNFLDWVSLVIILLFIYYFILRNFFLKFRKFKCLRCGQCCRLRVSLSKEDIERLKKSGHKDFIENKNSLKRINGYCKFLEIKNGKARCSVYKSRPEVCRWWPVAKFLCDGRCKSYGI